MTHGVPPVLYNKSPTSFTVIAIPFVFSVGSMTKGHFHALLINRMRYRGYVKTLGSSLFSKIFNVVLFGWIL